MGDSSGKTAIITVTYNKVPDFSCFEDAASLVDFVVICDNSTNPHVSAQLEEYCSRLPKFLLLRNGANLGISKAYNKAVAYAEVQGAFWLYFFDDDANFELEWLTKAKATWRNLEASGVPVGLLVPIISNDQTYINSNLGIKSSTSIISSAITSGVLTNTKVFNRCGGYNPAFFVDWADLEFNRRIKKGGYYVVRLNEVLVYQAFGRSLKGDGLRNRLVNAYIKAYSLVSLKLNKSNTLSTAYSLYSPSRLRSQQANAVWTLKHAGVGNSGFRLVLIMVHHLVLPKLLRREIFYPPRS